MSLFQQNDRGEVRVASLVQAAFFSIAIIVGGYFIARKIFNIPSRMDLVAFFTLAVLIPIFRRPMSGIYLLIIVPVFVPFIRRLYYLFAVRPGNDLIIVLPDIVVCLLFFVLVDRIRRREIPRFEDRRLWGVAWAFILFSLGRALIFNSFGIEEGLYKFKFAVLYTCCLFFGAFFLTRREQVVSVLKLTVVLGFVTALYAIKQMYFGFTEFEQIWLDQMRNKFVSLFIEGQARPFSTLNSPATLADFMLITLACSIILLRIPGERGRLFYFFSIPLNLFALLLTSVRSSWVGLLVGAIFWFVIAHRSSLRIKVALMAFLTLVFFMASGIRGGSGASLSALGLKAAAGRMASAQKRESNRKITDVFFTDRVSAIANPFEEHSMVARQALWALSLDMATRMPYGLFGYGLGNFDADSYYFTTLFDVGLIGFALFALLLFLIFRAGFKVYAEEEERGQRAIVQGFLCILFMTSVMNLTGSHISSHPADVYFWLTAGILLVIRRLHGRGDEQILEARDRIVDAT